MKRTNLVLDEQLLKTATQLMGAKTYSEAVNRALDESIRMAKIRGLLDFQGSGAWEGDLSEMRQDSTKTERRRKR